MTKDIAKLSPRLRAELNQIDTELDQMAGMQIESVQQDAHDALARLAGLSAVVGRINQIMSKVSIGAVTSKLDSWIQKIKSALSQIAKSLSALSYSVGVNVPFGISIAVSFTP